MKEESIQIMTSVRRIDDIQYAEEDHTMYAPKKEGFDWLFTRPVWCEMVQFSQHLDLLSRIDNNYFVKMGFMVAVLAIGGLVYTLAGEGPTVIYGILGFLAFIGFAFLILYSRYKVQEIQSNDVSIDILNNPIPVKHPHPFKKGEVVTITVNIAKKTSQ